MVHFGQMLQTYACQQWLTTGIHYSFYAPNFEKVEGAYCFGLVRLSGRPAVHPSVTRLKYAILKMDSTLKITDVCF